MVALLLLTALAPPARSVIVETKGGARVAGYLVREGEDAVVLSVPREDGARETRTLDRADVLQVFRPVAPERLEALRPEEPGAYRDYAEELAVKADDPEARDAARRLFLIAAHLDPARLGRGCLLGLAQLARTPDEARAARAMAFLLDPRHDPRTLDGDLPKASEPPARRHFVRALQAFRRGKTAEAIKEARRDGVAALFAASPGLMSHEEFFKECEDHPECRRCNQAGRVKCQRCNGTGQEPRGYGMTACPACLGAGSVLCPECGGRRPGPDLSADRLKSLLRAELWAEGAGPDEPPVKKASAAPEGPSWSRALTARPPSPVPALSLEGLTEFDPRASIYRDGRWEVP